MRGGEGIRLFDIGVLIDSPCSGTALGGGSRATLAHHARWPQERLTNLQDDLLEQGRRFVAAPGALVYATCSLLPCENEDRIEHFLSRHAEFVVMPASAVWPEGTAPPPGLDRFSRRRPCKPGQTVSSLLFCSAIARQEGRRTPKSNYVRSVLVIDFGSQVTQLIARRVREAGAYCEIVPFNKAEAALKEGRRARSFFSGGPAQRHRKPIRRRAAPKFVFTAGVPVLGICYGEMTMCEQAWRARRGRACARVRPRRHRHRETVAAAGRPWRRPRAANRCG